MKNVDMLNVCSLNNRSRIDAFEGLKGLVI